MPDLFRLENQSKADFDARRARLPVTRTMQRLPLVRLKNRFRFLGTEDLPPNCGGLPGFFCNLIRWRSGNGDEHGENSGGN